MKKEAPRISRFELKLMIIAAIFALFLILLLMAASINNDHNAKVFYCELSNTHADVANMLLLMTESDQKLELLNCPMERCKDNIFFKQNTEVCHAIQELKYGGWR